MLNTNTIYDLFKCGEYIRDVEILGAVNNIAVVLINGNAIRFYCDTGAGADDPSLELRLPHEADVSAIAVYANNIAANVNNEKLSDADFREYCKNTIQLVIDAL